MLKEEGGEVNEDGSSVTGEGNGLRLVRLTLN